MLSVLHYCLDYRAIFEKNIYDVSQNESACNEINLLTK